MQDFGRLLIILGIVLVILGGVLYWSKAMPGLGKLPGDFVIRNSNFIFYIPLATSLLLSAILTLLFYLFNKK